MKKCMMMAGVFLAVAGAVRAEGDAVSTLPEMVVVSSRAQTTEPRLPGYVSVLTGDELDAMNVLSVPDALETLPGIHFRSSSGTPAVDEITMRGFGENSQGRVLVLRNGQRVNRPDMAPVNWLQFPAANIERIEVLRGAESVLYGNNAIAGVINIISPTPSNELSGRVAADVADYQTLALRGAVNGGAGPVAANLNGEHIESDGYRHNSDFHADSAALNGICWIGGETSLKLDGASQHVEHQLPGALSKAEMNADPRQSLNDNDHVSSDFNSARVVLDAVLPFGRVSLPVGYSRKRIASDMESWFAYNELDIDSVSLLPTVTFDRPLGALENRLLLGVDYYHDAFGVDRYADEAHTLRDGDARVTRQTVGAYFSDALYLREDLILGSGLRLEKAWNDVRVKNGGLTTVDDDNAQRGSSFTLSLLKNFAERAKVYAKGGTVYRYPFIDEMVSYYGYGDQLYDDLDPERGWTLEAGVQAVIVTNLQVELAVFRIAMRDEVAFNPVTFENENLDDTLHQGVEAAVSWRIGALRLAANATYTDATFENGPDEDNRIPLVPEYTGGFFGRLELPGGAGITTDVKFIGDSYLGGDTPNSGDKLDGYAVADLFVDYRPSFVEGLRVYAGVNNLFDERYATVAYQGFDADGYYPAAGRTFQAGAGWDF